jgi:hypothetical protein
MGIFEILNCLFLHSDSSGVDVKSGVKIEGLKSLVERDSAIVGLEDVWMEGVWVEGVPAEDVLMEGVGWKVAEFFFFIGQSNRIFGPPQGPCSKI